MRASPPTSLAGARDRAEEVATQLPHRPEYGRTTQPGHALCSRRGPHDLSRLTGSRWKVDRLATGWDSSEMDMLALAASVMPRFFVSQSWMPRPHLRG